MKGDLNSSSRDSTIEYAAKFKHCYNDRVYVLGV